VQWQTGPLLQCFVLWWRSNLPWKFKIKLDGLTKPLFLFFIYLYYNMNTYFIGVIKHNLTIGTYFNKLSQHICCFFCNEYDIFKTKSSQQYNLPWLSAGAYSREEVKPTPWTHANSSPHHSSVHNSWARLWLFVVGSDKLLECFYCRIVLKCSMFTLWWPNL